MNKITKKILQNEIKNSNEVCLIGPMPIENYLKSSLSPIILVDGGTKHLSKLPHLKSRIALSIGDGDSSKKKLDITAPTIKNESDLELALDLIPKKTSLLFLDGFFPHLKKEKRLDHLLANLGGLFQFSLENRTYIQLNVHHFILPPGKHKITFHGEFSLFSIYPNQLKIKGNCEYQLIKTTPIAPFSPRCLSNIGTGEMEIETKKPLLFIF